MPPGTLTGFLLRIYTKLASRHHPLTVSDEYAEAAECYRQCFAEATVHPLIQREVEPGSHELFVAVRPRGDGEPWLASADWTCSRSCCQPDTPGG
jgi:hypothetical protein